jgi:tetratricopeptide (TPR) repeat protein
MFKINIYLKFALIAVFLIGGIVLAVLFGFWYSFPLILVGITLLVSYIMLGTIQSAAELVQTQDFDRAEKRLNLTLTPKLLYVTNRAFFYILKGSFAMNRREQNISEEWFQRALKLKLPSENEKAMIYLQLANINASKNKWNAAKKYFKDAKKMKVTERQLKEQLKQFEQVMASQGNMRHLAAMGKAGQRYMGGPGGKRKRPRMR